MGKKHIYSYTVFANETSVDVTTFVINFANLGTKFWQKIELPSKLDCSEIPITLYLIMGME